MDEGKPEGAAPVTVAVNACAEEIARTMFDGMPSGIIVIDRDFRVQQVNQFSPLAEARRRLDGRAAVLRPFPPRRPEPCPDCPCAVTFRTGESATTVHTGVDAQGDTTWAELVSLPVRDEAGQVTHALEAARDVSERERHLRELGRVRLGYRYLSLKNCT